MDTLIFYAIVLGILSGGGAVYAALTECPPHILCKANRLFWQKLTNEKKGLSSKGQ